MGFAAGDTHARIGGLAGRPAEQAATAFLLERGRKPVRFGLDGVDTARAVATTWPAHIRGMPDLLVAGHFVEVQGTNKPHVYFKAAKLDALAWWQTHAAPMTVRYLIWLQHRDEIIATTLDTIRWAVRHPDAEWSEQGPGDDAKPGWWVPIAVFRQVEVVDAWQAQKAWRDHPDRYAELQVLRGE